MFQVLRISNTFKGINSFSIQAFRNSSKWIHFNFIIGLGFCNAHCSHTGSFIKIHRSAEQWNGQFSIKSYTFLDFVRKISCLTGGKGFTMQIAHCHIHTLEEHSGTDWLTDFTSNSFHGISKYSISNFIIMLLMLIKEIRVNPNHFYCSFAVLFTFLIENHHFRQTINNFVILPPSQYILNHLWNYFLSMENVIINCTFCYNICNICNRAFIWCQAENWFSFSRILVIIK